MSGIVDFSNFQNSALQIGVLSLIMVFLIIIVLVVIFSVTPRLRRGYVRDSKSGNNTGIKGGKSKSSNIPAGDSAAIAAAIYLFMDEIHDNENRVVTIKRVSRTYSPWNSKIYGVNWMKNR